ncbi:4Fe-4S binding protein [Desulfosporosinus nitroreducens]|uniref:4Fe-4S binding protein n=1 Tax=Desulfosporosinus nitroreducens TaxID=2018668 RepID=UPI00207C3363|nr:4Fe-4S binding protein [Desulfosporosinus nitroreducens]MCO1601192.1 4Fe-4S binding protein [Desulfosporosinus nitroreducens]
MFLVLPVWGCSGRNLQSLEFGQLSTKSQTNVYSPKGSLAIPMVSRNVGALFNNPGVASYEPFSVFFDGDGNTAQWIIMGLILLLSMFILRFWCRCFCPIGAFLDFLALCKRKSKKLLRNKSVPEDSGERTAFLIKISGCEGNCTGCKKEVAKASPLSSSDKLVACVIYAIYMLIFGALLQNTELF